ncbi:SDR family oxidoreductase [Halobacillus salinarum]|uniref:SDR family oxidoreductase n=1 Tax=Halobacillus salinarum TaxID=2932257 RepID=A0ABY4ELK6_9BACI|nr:SDR family NAD(P)-dependent oxidoreductase [Halobacillus salinarum]UOQ45049.1 SDR family oxidoreductase [Halobacillus salinarum]
MKDEVIIITGSTRGIGRAAAEYFSNLGAAVVINGRSEEQVEQVVRAIRQKGGRAVGTAVSVTNEHAGDTLVETAVNAYGKVTGLINNAGFVSDRISYRMELDSFTSVLDVHVKGSFICSKAVTNYLRSKSKPGFIINITSLAGLAGNPGQVNYSAAKGAVNGMTWTLAKELMKDNIIVYALSPAAVTDMTRPHVEQMNQKHTDEEESYWDIGSAEQVAAFLSKMIINRRLSDSGAIYSINKEEEGYWLPPSYVML